MSEKQKTNEACAKPMTMQARANHTTWGGEMQVRTRKLAIAKLMNARNEIDEVLSIAGARYDPVVLSQTVENDLSVFRDFLNHTIQKLQEEQ